MALGERTPEDEGHVRGCPRCQAELVRFSQVVAVARDGGEPARWRPRRPGYGSGSPPPAPGFRGTPD